MTTSGTVSYNPVRDTIIYRALRMVGGYASSASPRAEQVNDAIDVLNIMLKDWQMDGLLWLKIWATLFLNKGQVSYVLAPSTYTGFDHAAFAYTPGITPYVQTTLSSASILGATSVTVTSATGIASADFIGIADDNGLIEWFYASPVGTTITLFSDAALTVSSSLAAAAASGNVVYSHKVLAQINRPTRIFSFARKYYDPIAANGYEIPFDPISRSEYVSLPNKTVQGKVIETYYDPQLVAGVLYVWPTADSPGDKLVLTMDRPIQDILNDTDTYDIPQEALNAVAYNLAVMLEPEYPLDNSAFQKLTTMAVAAKTKLLSYNRENVSTLFQPDLRSY
jgi:hypothetical protein